MKRFFVGLCALATIGLTMWSCADKELTESRYLASATTTAQLYSLDAESGTLSQAGAFLRGTELTIYPNCTERIDKIRYIKVLVDGNELYAPEEALVLSPAEVVLEQSVWVRTPATILADLSSSKIAGFADRKSVV